LEKNVVNKIFKNKLQREKFNNKKLEKKNKKTDARQAIALPGRDRMGSSGYRFPRRSHVFL